MKNAIKFAILASVAVFTFSILFVNDSGAQSYTYESYIYVNGGCGNGYLATRWCRESWWTTSANSYCICYDGYHEVGSKYYYNDWKICGTASFTYHHYCDVSITYRGAGTCQPVDVNPATVDVSHSPSSPKPDDVVTITATATDPDKSRFGIKKIDILVDNRIVKTCDLVQKDAICIETRCSGFYCRHKYCAKYADNYPSSGTCEFSSTFSEGKHTYYAKVTDYYNRKSLSQTKSFTVSLPDNPPSVSVEASPAP